MDFFEAGTKHDELIVFLHGFGNASKRLQSAREVTREVKPDADFYAPALPFARNRLCLIKAETIVVDLIKKIDQLNQTHCYSRIALVGHSFGAILARKLALIANGEQCAADGDLPAPFEPEFSNYRQPRTWANKIERLVLIAGMNRGWTTSSTLDWITSMTWGFGQLFGELAFSGKPTIFALRRGAPFLVNTRLQWLALMDPLFGTRPNLVVTQLLGTKDDHVAPDDNVDYSIDAQHHNAKQSYFYLEVPLSGHVDVVDMSDKGKPSTAHARSGRKEAFLAALTATQAELEDQCIKYEQMTDSLPPKSSPDVSDVVFVVHGIRDKGYWTQKIARTIKRHSGNQFESCTESYGYFAMLPFILPNVRQRKVEWLMDRYVEVRARYPRARLHYVGHSNGTYLCSQALEDYKAVRFDRIVFAGSVVRRDYPWLKLIRPDHGSPRVKQVLNYVATRDWVVAMLPNSVQRWRRFNLGSAGHDGFIQAHVEGPVHQVTYIAGDHSVGCEEANWDNIARFIVSGTLPAKDDPLLSSAPSKKWQILGKLATPLVLAVVSIIAGVGAWLVIQIFSEPAPLALIYVALFLGYLTTLRLFITRF